jgi:hypothetical protein
MLFSSCCENVLKSASMLYRGVEMTDRLNALFQDLFVTVQPLKSSLQQQQEQQQC